jgi:hypothetical protein
VREKTPSIIVDTYETALNANMCDALSDLALTAMEGDAAFYWQLSPNIKDDAYYAPPKVVKVKSNLAFEYLSEASRQLHPPQSSLDEQPQRQPITGFVTRLESKEMYRAVENSSDNLVSIIQTDGEEEEGRRITVKLDFNDYKEACFAHTFSLKVTMDGLAAKRGRSWYLLEPMHFRVLKTTETA